MGTTDWQRPPQGPEGSGQVASPVFTPAELQRLRFTAYRRAQGYLRPGRGRAPRGGAAVRRDHGLSAHASTATHATTAAAHSARGAAALVARLGGRPAAPHTPHTVRLTR